MKAEPQKEHEWLQKLVGAWTMEAECAVGPDQPATKSKGSETVRRLGSLWVVCDGQGEMPGVGEARLQMTLGYDPARQRFVGSWVGSMMTHMWVYEGSLDDTGKVLTLATQGPSFAGDGKTARYQDIIEFKDDDYRLLRSRTLNDDGSWNEFMAAHYRRQK